MTPTELEEAVALAIECVDHPYSVEHMARAAIRVVIEAAAKIADANTHSNGEEYDYFDSGKVVTAREIAAAIRRLAQIEARE